MTTSFDPRTLAGPALLRPISVRSWPARDSGWWTIVPAIAVGTLGGAIGTTVGHWLAGFLAALLVAASSWRYWLPVDFDLDATGVTQRLGHCRWRIPWAAVCGYAVLPHGAQLWPAAPGPLTAATRAVCIPWNGQREAVLAILAEQLGPPFGQ